MSRTATLRRQDRSGDKPAIAMPGQVRLVPIEDLIPYATNARTHSPEQIAQIAASIQEFGFTNPCLINGANGLIAGHGRVLGGQRLGMTEIPCIELAHLSERQRRAYIIADNKLALNADWDNDILASELDTLNDEFFDVDLLGFDDKELENIWGADGLGEGGDAPAQSSGVSWAVIVECDDEASQVELLERLQYEGYRVRGSIG
jgi:ParB-like chromosome segregation protein Spo0J